MNPLSKIRNLIEESQRIGFRAFRYRVGREAVKLFGLDVKRHPVCSPDIKAGMQGAPEEVTRAPSLFYEWWSQRRLPFFVQDTFALQDFYWRHLNAEQQKELVLRGKWASKGRIFAFRGWYADFGEPPNWALNPVTGATWLTSVHAKRVLTSAEKHKNGDIKYTWEIGRFLHVQDILRAFFLLPTSELIDRLVIQLEYFQATNPRNEGPHWISEQEVGIRAAMYALTLFVLKDAKKLHGELLQLILSHLVECAIYCDSEIEFARRCISNNHFIAGALGMLIPSYVIPWHPLAKRWRARGRQLLIEALETQWWQDGGYVQPSFNYHRLGLSYLLWLLRLAELDQDELLVLKIKEVFARALPLFVNMSHPQTGRLPNWGPNDGSSFGLFSSCDFLDYRPLLTCLNYALNGTRLYESGPWDESLLWLWGKEALDARVQTRLPESASYPQAGLHVLRSENSTAILRCGPILSRYGQHADQLHLDLWFKGENVCIDPGSYNYASPHFHEWFRGTDAHNTMTINGQSQMEPYRQFLFLKWPSVSFFDLGVPPKGVVRWVGGWHTGYWRLSAKVLHGRLLLQLEDSWLVVDFLNAQDCVDSDRFKLGWHFLEHSFQLDQEANRFLLELKWGSFLLKWCGAPVDKVQVVSGSENGPDGWTSYYYGRKEGALSLRLEGHLQETVLLASWLGPLSGEPSLSTKGATVSVGHLSIDLTKIQKQIRVFSKGAK